MPHTRSNRGFSCVGSAPRIPGRERSSGPLSRKNALPFSPVPLTPPPVQGARSAVSRLTFAADAGGQCGLVLSVVAGIAPVLMDQVGAGALSRPARRRPELTARAAAPVRAVSPVHHRAGPVLRRGARRRGAGAEPGAPVGAWPARRSSPARRLDDTAGRLLMVLPVYGGIGPPERTGLRLACPRTALRSAWPHVSGA